MSAEKAYLLVRNISNIFARFSVMDGPFIKQSFKDGVPLDDLAEQLYTILIGVVGESFMTA